MFLNGKNKSKASLKSLRTSGSKQYLNQPINFRKIKRLRSDHQSIDANQSSWSNQRGQLHSESQLEHQISLRENIKKSRAIGIESKKQQSTSVMSVKYPYQSRNTPSHFKHETTKRIFDESSNDNIKFFPSENKAKQYESPVKQYKQSQQTADLDKKIQQIDDRLQKLIHKKLNLLSQKTHNKKKKQSTKINTKMNILNEQFYNLINEIKSLRNKYNNVHVFNNKIRFIETLIAQQNTEVQLMKKYYSNLNSHKIKGKIGDFNKIKSKLGEVCKQLYSYQRTKKRYNTLNDYIKKYSSMIEQTTNKHNFKEPKSQDYQSYRYKQKEYSINRQPLPRSSYKRQYLHLRSQPDQMIVNRDHSPYNPTLKTPVSSMYCKDYTRVNAEIINHKELDAYKNKYNTLKISYMPQKKTFSPSINEIHQSLKDSKQYSTLSRMKQYVLGKSSQQELQFNKNMHISQSKRQFLGSKPHQRSSIKHKNLKQLSYYLKQQFKA